MNIAIIGYGKMGKTIEKIALERGHTIPLKINSSNLSEFSVSNLKDKKIDLAIEFTSPLAALDNITTCFEAGIKVVSGSTAWLEGWDSAIESMTINDGSFIYASNFSVGVNIFFALNEKLASLMNSHKEYNVQLTEVHHTAKLDAPSGTAITLSEGISKQLDHKSGWTDQDDDGEKIFIESIRKDPAPGTHMIKYSSEIDEIEIIHTAKSRNGFAMGAVLAAEFLADKKGLYTMNDVLGL